MNAFSVLAVILLIIVGAIGSFFMWLMGAFGGDLWLFYGSFMPITVAVIISYFILRNSHPKDASQLKPSRTYLPFVIVGLLIAVCVGIYWLLSIFAI